MGERKFDLAENTFVEKWPDWLRWLLFIPASIIAPLTFVIIYSVLQGWFLDFGENAFYFNLLRGIAYGGGIVFVGALVAPKKQKLIALIFLILIAMMSGIALFYQVFDEFTFNAFLEDIITIAAAGYATYYIFNENN